MRSVPALSDRPVVHTPVGAIEATWETNKKPISALRLQIASNDAEAVAKVAKVDGLEGRLQIEK